MGRLSKALGLSWSDRFLVLEAMLVLGLARLALRAIPEPRLFPWFCRRPRGPHPDDVTRIRQIGKIRWAVLTGARHAPWRTVCFPQAIAAQTMLRRRGIGTTLVYGARLSRDDGLSGHVWLQDGDTIIIGERAAAGYRALISFPPGPQPSAIGRVHGANL